MKVRPRITNARRDDCSGQSDANRISRNQTHKYHDPVHLGLLFIMSCWPTLMGEGIKVWPWSRPAAVSFSPSILWSQILEGFNAVSPERRTTSQVAPQSIYK